MGKEDFKAFVSKRPELATYVENNEMTWQKFYELYDLYGEKEEIWQKYTKKNNNSLSNFTNFFDKFDPDTLKDHIENAQKAIDIFSELTNKANENIATNIKPSIERPLNKFFGD